MKPFRFERSALAEYEAAIRWYDERSDVGPAFVAAVEDAIKRIRRSPRAFGRWRAIERDNLRRCVVRRFPFIVIYQVDPEVLTIVAVAHSRREPAYWTKRLSRERGE